MTGAAQRVDKWLWHARMLRTRSMAAKFAESGKLRINGVRVTRSSQPVTQGDVLTFVLGDRVRVLKVAAIVGRRGPYADAQHTYEDLSPPPPDRPPEPGPQRPDGSGRPTKRDRRHLDALLRGEE